MTDEIHEPQIITGDPYVEELGKIIADLGEIIAELIEGGNA